MYLSKWLRQFRAVPLKKGGARGRGSAGGAIASGSAKFPAEGFCPQRAPPKSPQKTPRGPQNDSQNEPKWSKMRSWGPSWATLGTFW